MIQDNSEKAVTDRILDALMAGVPMNPADAGRLLRREFDPPSPHHPAEVEA